MVQQRKAPVKAYTRNVRGQVVRVKRHARTVTYGSRRRTGKGVFRMRRAWRHLTLRPERGRRKRRWSKKKKAAMFGLGCAEILGWTLFRTTGGIVAMLALTFSSLALLFASGAHGKMVRPSQPKRPVRKSPDGL